MSASVNYFYQYPFIYSSYYPKKKKKKLYKISIDTLWKIYKEKKIFLHSKRREYLATGTQGQNISTFFPTLRKKIYHIVSFSYYLQLKH